MDQHPAAGVVRIASDASLELPGLTRDSGGTIRNGDEIREDAVEKPKATDEGGPNESGSKT